MLKITKNKMFLVGFLFIITGVVLKIAPVITSTRQSHIDEISVDTFINDTSEVEVHESREKEPIVKPKVQTKPNYSMALEIPQIRLKKGLYDMKSKYNSVNYGIQILKTSSSPTVGNGNLILASHSGNSSVSYFSKLNQLNIGDEVNVYYNGYKYIYDIAKNYEIEKSGTAKVYREHDKTAITLITCKKNSNKQLVYIGYLISKEVY